MNTRQPFLYMFQESVRKYLAYDNITEILVNGAKQIFVERHGKLLEVSETFSCEAVLLVAVVNISQYVNCLLNEKNLILGTRFQEGSCIHIIVISCQFLVSTVIAIQFLFKEKLSAEWLLAYGSVSPNRWRMTGKSPDGSLVGEFVKLAEPGFADEARLAGLEW